MSSFYVTTPIYYVNDVPHLGHAYTTIIADVLARYHRARQRRARMLTGTDEHGQKVERSAAQRGETPQELADRVVQRYKQTWERLGIQYDDFIRTTEERHARVVRALWQRLAERGDIYLGEYDGLYCVGCEEYFTEGQAGDDGRCPVHGTPLEHLKQPSYFFRMSRYQQPLLEHFEEHPDFVLPEIRRREIVSFVRGGLRDLSISRTTFRWGIAVPDDSRHVIYVWMDALTNYISALGGFEEESSLYKAYWPASLQLIGKDILRFHAVYWPAMLLAAGLPLPRHVFAHGWWTVNGQKMSKSLRNVVEPNMLADDVGADALRYFVARETPLGSDGDFSHEGLIQRINSELANDLGNLLSRSIAMAARYCRGRGPRFSAAPEAEELDASLIALARRARDEAAAHFEAFAPSRALEAIWELVRGANKYIDATAPYKLVKEPGRERRVEEVVANFLEALRWIALMVAPVMPQKAAEMLRQLGWGAASASSSSWPGEWGEMPEGLQLVPGPALFPRIDEERKVALLSRWSGASGCEAPPAVPPGAGRGEGRAPRGADDGSAAGRRPAAGAGGGSSKRQREKTKMTEEIDRAGAGGAGARVTIDELARLDLRVAQILEAGRIEGADRLLLLKVDLGSEQRQVVAGIAPAYSPEELIGRKVILVANLEPAAIRGVRSEGMILAAGGKTVEALGTFDRDVAPGTKVR